ncbi:MAG: hypothetical protein FWE91_08805 [Defluviitaleaceae bacterium]|nr:hypothetical protein [Defluviitaleaceae bacterium]MCL2836031.1 hypothetical protein [Defluviitaleaceae bacterium]
MDEKHKRRIISDAYAETERDIKSVDTFKAVNFPRIDKYLNDNSGTIDKYERGLSPTDELEKLAHTMVKTFSMKPILIPSVITLRSVYDEIPNIVIDERVLRPNDMLCKEMMYAVHREIAAKRTDLALFDRKYLDSFMEPFIDRMEEVRGKLTDIEGITPYFITKSLGLIMGIHEDIIK